MSFLRNILSALTRPIRANFASPLKLISAPRRLLGMSLPARAAVIVAFVLWVVTIAVYLVFFFMRDRAAVEVWFRFGRILVILGLNVAIPIVVYRALKLWLEGDDSEFPDIDDAWKEGVAALEANGLDITEIPLFLVVGVRDERQMRALIDASDRNLRVQDVPQGPAALHWYANRDAIYLACTETCRLGKLARIAASVESPRAAGLSPSPQPGGQGDDMLRGTIVTSSVDVPQQSTQATRPDDVPGPAPGAGRAIDIRGTMVPGEVLGKTVDDSAEPRYGSLTAGESAVQTARLRYVCQLLNRARQPVCPMNGVLTMLPFEALERGGPLGGIEVQRAAKEDLVTIRQELRLRAPVTALVVGMENESGFRELVRRVGRDRAKAQRFGKGFNVWNPPIPEQIEAVTTHACGAFEDWTYMLFREQDGLSKPGNTKLYTLLCKIRSNLRKRLTNILVAAYSDDRDEMRSDGEPLLFSGCYFAAVGETEDRQAFVKSVFDKLLDEEEELDWSEEALVEDQRYQQWTQFGLLLCAVMVVVLIYVLVKWWYA